MKIQEYKELKALNMLLAKIKFQEDLEFSDFKLFSGSPIIAEIFSRVHKEYIQKSKELGYLEENYVSKFQFNSPTGQALRKKIDELSTKEMETLVENNNLVFYLKTLVAPLDCNNEEMGQLINYFNNSFNIKFSALKHTD